jgi:hypothetical protein
MVTRVIFAYRLVATANIGGADTVYSQYLRGLLQIEDGRRPLKAFDEDLTSLIRVTREGNKQVILVIDVNQNIVTGRFSAVLRQQSLREVVTEAFQGIPPPTHSRGSDTINDIFASTSIQSDNGGYLDFRHFLGENRALWWDAHEITIFGNKNPPAQTPSP